MKRGQEVTLEDLIAQVYFDDSCWLWMGKTSAKGYGRLQFRKRNHPAHRVSWMLQVGEIPEGYDLHHICTNKRCVRIEHLQPISHGSHSRSHLSVEKARLIALRARRARTKCPNGHPYTEGNFITKYGYRRCLVCRRKDRMSKYWRDKAVGKRS